MSVVLVNPRVAEDVAAGIVTPPLGLAYLSAVLKAAGVPVQVIDAEAGRLELAELQSLVVAARPALVGVTAMTPTADSAYRTVAALRPLAPALALGGAHASALGRRTFEDCPTPLDVVVLGEAEDTIVELARRALVGKRGAELAMPGVLAAGGGEGEEEWPKVEDLDRLPFPDRAALPEGRYHHPLFGRAPVTSLITSRGCPYRCVFCDKQTCGSKWRPRSAENVCAELELIARRRPTPGIMIYDDLFTLSSERVIEICRRVVAAGLSLRWKCEGRVNRVDPEALLWMKRAGCVMIAYGVESAHAATLEFLRKDITIEQAREAFARTRSAGIQTLGYFILGVPGETVEDELETARLAISLGADYAQFGVLSPFPGTPLFELAAAKGWLHEGRARGPAEMGSRRPLLLDGYWTLPRLDRVVAAAHRKFYFRPSYLGSRLMKLRSAAEFYGAAEQGARLLGWSLRKRMAAGVAALEQSGPEEQAGVEMKSETGRLKACYFGTYSRGEEYARNNAIIGGLTANGVEVVPCQIDVFPTHEEKMAATRKSIAGQAIPFLKAYVKLASQYLAAPDHDFLFVGYIGHIDVFPAWLLAKWRKKPIVFDAFYSLYDTMILDRGLYPDGSLRARLLRWLDKWSCELSDLILLDTWAHVDYFRDEFQLQHKRFHSIPLGTDEKNFYPRPWPEEDGVLDCICYSSYIPLHGLEVQVDAAKLLGERKDIRFTFVGKGQLYPAIRARAEAAGLDNARFIEWVTHAELVEMIARADACLGIFGLTEKAARVIPYKAYEALAMRKPLITGDSRAARELLVDGEHALLSPMGDARALAERILRLRDDPDLRRRIAEAGHALFLKHGTSRAMARSILERLCEQWPEKAALIGNSVRSGEAEAGKTREE